MRFKAIILAGGSGERFGREGVEKFLAWSRMFE